MTHQPLKYRRGHYVWNGTGSPGKSAWQYNDNPSAGHSIALHYASDWELKSSDPGFEAFTTKSYSQHSNVLVFLPNKKLRITGKVKTYHNSGQTIGVRLVPFWHNNKTWQYFLGSYNTISSVNDYHDYSGTSSNTNIFASPTEDTWAGIDVYIETGTGVNNVVGLQLTAKQGTWSNSLFPTGPGVAELFVEEIL